MRIAFPVIRRLSARKVELRQTGTDALLATIQPPAAWGDAWGWNLIDGGVLVEHMARQERPGDGPPRRPPARQFRRKDLLLQENGYFVLRFLAEDVGAHLDDVLDAILRTLSHRKRGQL
jgi:hypothetical protein